MHEADASGASLVSCVACYVLRVACAPRAEEAKTNAGPHERKRDPSEMLSASRGLQINFPT
eukprot:5905168-Prymnesium_polylepis.1